MRGLPAVIVSFLRYWYSPERRRRDWELLVLDPEWARRELRAIVEGKP